jgi:hypothetical protein
MASNGKSLTPIVATRREMPARHLAEGCRARRQVEAACDRARGVRVVSGIVMVAAVALAALVGSVDAANTAPCGGTCFRVARGEARECRGSADGAFLIDRALCLDRSPVCVAACLERSQECRDATGIGQAIVTCTATLQTALARCVTNHPTAPAKRAQCVDHAQLGAFQCRNAARRAAAPALRRCTLDSVVCRRGCGPGSPPRGETLCLDEANLKRREALRTCRRDFQVSGSACIDKDDACVQPCRDERDGCEAPIDAELGRAVGACLQQRNATIVACRAANPVGSTALATCEETADAAAFTCRLAARDAAAPGLAACSDAFVACIRACPAP